MGEGGEFVCKCGCVWYSGSVLFPVVWTSVTKLLFEVILVFVELVDLFTV